VDRGALASAVRRAEVGHALITAMTPSPARFDLDQCADCDPVVGIMGRACMRGRGILLVQLGPPQLVAFF